MFPYHDKPKRAGVRILKPLKKPELLLKLRRKQPPVPLWLPEKPIRLPGQYPRQSIKLSDLLIILTLFVTILACTCSAFTYGQITAFGQNVAAIRQNSQPVFMRTRLPTLTPTLLPDQLAETPEPAYPADAPDLPPSDSSDSVLSAALPSASTETEIEEAWPVLSDGGFSDGVTLPAVPDDSSSGEAPWPDTSDDNSADEFTLPPFDPEPAEPPDGNDPDFEGFPTVQAGPITLPTLALSTPLPTPTRTPVAATPAATVTVVPTVTATVEPTATTVITPTPTIEPTPPLGWSFTGVRVYDQETGFLLSGKLTNDTGVPQELEDVNGAFYDVQNQLIGDKNNTYDYWLVNVVPPGGTAPFELTILDAPNTADYALSVEAHPSDENIRQDFEFTDIEQQNKDGDYCLKGKLRNPGEELPDFLTIVAILYDAQGNVINFDYYDEPDPASIQGDDTSSFDLCLSPPNQDVANYELRAWGR